MSHLHRRQKSSSADEESIPAHWGPCHFQLAALVCHHQSLSLLPVAPTASQPRASILSPRACQLWGGRAALPTTHCLLAKQELSTQAGKAAWAELFGSVTAWDGEVESYVNSHEGRDESSEPMDGFWCREPAPAPQGKGLPVPLVIFTHFSSFHFPQNEQAYFC